MTVAAEIEVLFSASVPPPLAVNDPVPVTAPFKVAALLLANVNV